MLILEEKQDFLDFLNIAFFIFISFRNDQSINYSLKKRKEKKKNKKNKRIRKHSYLITFRSFVEVLKSGRFIQQRRNYVNSKSVM